MAGTGHHAALISLHWTFGFGRELRLDLKKSIFKCLVTGAGVLWNAITRLTGGADLVDLADLAGQANLMKIDWRTLFLIFGFGGLFRFWWVFLVLGGLFWIDWIDWRPLSLFLGLFDGTVNF